MPDDLSKNEISKTKLAMPSPAAADDAPGAPIKQTAADDSFAGPLAEHNLSDTTLGDYRLVRKIAEGGMGEIYQAIQVKLDRQVALKVVTPNLTNEPEFLKRFEREAKAAAALNHPNLVQVHDFGQADGRHYLIMEYIEGENLTVYVQRKGKLSVAEALDVIEQAAGALKAACQKSIIHRDIKPANLLITRDGRVKVSDLGLAKVLTDNTEVTATGVGLGSPHFLAPEQASDARHVDHRADIYSLGLTLLFLLTGKRPFDGGSAFSVVLAHANKPLPTGRELGTDLPPEAEALVRRMAAKDPEDRYPDYDALLADLQAVKAGFAPRAPRRRFRLPQTQTWLAASVVLLAVIGALAFSFWPRPPADDPREADERFRGRPLPAAANAPREQNLLGGPPGMRGPGFAPPRPGGGPGGPGFAQQIRFGQMPFPLMPRRNHTPLAEGPVDSMLAAAHEYAAAHPEAYLDNIDRYRQVWSKAAGTAQESQAEREYNMWRTLHEVAASEKLQEYEAKMDEQIKAGKSQEAWDVWKEFPENLRSIEVDAAIISKLDQKLPPDFRPEP